MTPTDDDVEMLSRWFEARGIGTIEECMDENMASEVWLSLRIAVRWARMKGFAKDDIVFAALGRHFYRDDIGDDPTSPNSTIGCLFEAIFQAGCCVGYRTRSS
jgi:hypothetical protein